MLAYPRFLHRIRRVSMTTDDIFGVDDIEDDVETVPENTTIAKIREAQKAAATAAKAEKKRADEAEAKLAVYLQKERDQAVASVFTEVGLDEKKQALFLRVNPDLDTEAITADAVKAFANEYGLTTSSGETVEEPVATPEGFAPAATPVAGDPTVISIDDAAKLIREGKYDEAQKLYEQGKVEKLPRGEDGAPIVDWLAQR
jgi:peptidoglycan hydrolase-like protein with peptidoglycan-binding domain